MRSGREVSGGGPSGEGAFAAWGAGAGEDGGEDGLADGEAIADLDVRGGQDGIDASGEVEFDGEVVESGDGPGADRGEVKGDRVLFLVKFEDIVDAAEMGEDADGGFAVITVGLDDAVVADAVGLIGLERRHAFRIHHTQRPSTMVLVYYCLSILYYLHSATGEAAHVSVYTPRLASTRLLSITYLESGPETWRSPARAARQQANQSALCAQFEAMCS